jgi:hypothetical protein
LRKPAGDLGVSVEKDEDQASFTAPATLPLA